MGEIILRNELPFFYGYTDLELLSKIFSVLGTPNEENWPGVTTLSRIIEFTPMEG